MEIGEGVGWEERGFKPNGTATEHREGVARLAWNPYIYTNDEYLGPIERAESGGPRACIKYQLGRPLECPVGSPDGGRGERAPGVR
jgi:hypothetical protein